MRSNHHRPPAVEPGLLPVQQSEFPRLFQLGNWAARASECLLERIAPNKSIQGYTFVFNRAGQIIPVSIPTKTLVAESEVSIVRALAMGVMIAHEKPNR